MRVRVCVVYLCCSSMCVCVYVCVCVCSAIITDKANVTLPPPSRFVTITGNPVAANYAQMLVLQKVPDATSV